MAMLRSIRWMLLFAGAASLLAIGGTLPARAQTYPSQPVKIVVPFAAGGGVDQVARIIAPKLSEVLGQPVVIENRGGAGASLGAAAVASAPPDGYTLLLGTGSTHGTNSSVYPKLSYDPVRDFVPVVQVTTSPLVLIVPPSLPAKSVEELIALGAQQARRTELRVLRHRQHQPSRRPNCSTPWPRSRRTTSRTGAPRRR